MSQEIPLRGEEEGPQAEVQVQAWDLHGQLRPKKSPTSDQIFKDPRKTGPAQGSGLSIPVFT